MNADDALDAARELQLLSDTLDNVMFHGLSMDPLLFEGDTVIVEPVGFDEIETGDIITYRYLDRYPTRRVVAIRPDRLTMWCDAWPDELFSAVSDDVLGRAVARIRNGDRLDATDTEWVDRRQRALRAYRCAVARRLPRRVARGIRWRVQQRSLRPARHQQA